MTFPVFGQKNAVTKQSRRIRSEDGERSGLQLTRDCYQQEQYYNQRGRFPTLCSDEARATFVILSSNSNQAQSLRIVKPNDKNNPE
ncbi:hypothetical protein NPIL_383581 [Nephila pilipes]|uniref:Uncharacterized protein n=1 Tax=Nephila pilipes TaxID=299642 RepID=A0A8X6NXD0_NEPPI|nr:hypothetical protein NPIL_383581 [Nephila pilipes]